MDGKIKHQALVVLKKLTRDLMNIDKQLPKYLKMIVHNASVDTFRQCIL